MNKTIRNFSGETIRTMTPVEYQKAHAEEDYRARRVEDFRRFMDFLVTELGDYPFTETNSDERENLIQNYLGCDWNSVPNRSRKL